MFKVKYSQSGTNNNKKETSTYMVFLGFISECEKGELGFSTKVKIL